MGFGKGSGYVGAWQGRFANDQGWTWLNPTGNPYELGAAFGAGFVLDLTAGSKETAERTEAVQTGVRESPACETGAGAGSVVSFAIAGGPSLSCTTAADGSCQVTIAADTWQASGGTLVVNVSVDGRLLRHEELKQSAP